MIVEGGVSKRPADVDSRLCLRVSAMRSRSELEDLCEQGRVGVVCVEVTPPLGANPLLVIENQDTRGSLHVMHAVMISAGLTDTVEFYLGSVGYSGGSAVTAACPNRDLASQIPLVAATANTGTLSITATDLVKLGYAFNGVWTVPSRIIIPYGSALYLKVKTGNVAIMGAVYFAIPNAS